MKDDAVGVQGDQLSVGIVPTNRHAAHHEEVVTDAHGP